ncbi:MAG: acyltransferase [Candidatus Pacebacteria bacterium]|nr:acyltransferase [Candidatus Paceibacterota bacterium]MBP9866822.1 acyltransferase [Candidatus Paceibacterota bacterium]
MYFAFLDLLRFFSAVAVLFHHTFTFHYGKLGVYLFFIISGFVIYFSLKKGTKEYVVGRFLRLYPLFWISCTLTYLVTIFYGNNLPLKNYFVSMLLFNDGKIASMIDGSYWTLTFEFLFYVYIGIFVWFFSTKRLEWFYASWLAISFFAFFFHLDQLLIMKLLSVRFAPYFVFGGVLALIVDKFSLVDIKTKIVYLTTLFASAILPLYVSASLRAQQGSISNFTGSFEWDEMLIVESFFLIVPLVVFLSYFSFSHTKRLTKICFMLGGLTYPLYLLHWKIGETLITSKGYLYGEVSYFSIMIALGIILLSYIFYVYDIRIRKLTKHKMFKM